MPSEELELASVVAFVVAVVLFVAAAAAAAVFVLVVVEFVVDNVGIGSWVRF